MANTFKGILDSFKFYFELAIVGDLLPLAAATLIEVRAGRGDVLCGRRYDIHQIRTQHVGVHLSNASSYFISGNAFAVDENTNTIRHLPKAADAFALVGNIHVNFNVFAVYVHLA